MTGSPAPTPLDFSQIRQRLAGKEGVTYWRSLDELADTYEFQEYLRKEFPRQAAPLESGVDRRDFLKLLGASMALAGLSACARPPMAHEKIVPYVRQDDEITPGKPLFFATAVTYGGYAEGVLAESHQGRPTKLEGNPDHPASLGATGAVTQAQVLNLYDPDRSQVVMQGENESSWQAFTEALAAALASSPEGAGLALLTEHVTSPTLAGQLAQFQATYPQARWFQYDTLHQDNVVAGARLAFGSDVLPVYDFGSADVVLSLDSDFLDEGPGRLAYARAFADRRRVLAASDSMNRLYQLETSPSATGTLADHRIALKPSSVAAAAAAIAAAVGVAGAATTALPAGLSQERFDALVADLQGAGAAALVVAGDSQPAVVHALAAAMNEALGSVGTTVSYIPSVSARPAVHVEELAELTTALRTGDVTNLIIIGANPAYTAPADLEFATALSQAQFSAHLGHYRDETGMLCDWHVPQT
ncbi:MAG TPA: TAT-variant-translocated molybdopterin oxidoreductase, partial [Trueperaceae bacterium]|nr:TAT-variant-translocated molybdopterin oxidoreductase [Trueperaceae bacterium]